MNVQIADPVIEVRKFFNTRAVPISWQGTSNTSYADAFTFIELAN